MFFRILGAQLIALAKLCMRLKGSKAEEIHEHFADTTLRFEAGDQSMVPQLNENGKRVDRAAAAGDGLCVELQKVRRKNDQDFEPLLPQEDSTAWLQTRAIEGVANRQVIKICRDQRVNSPNVQNSCSQAVLGYDGSATNFKQQNGISAHVPLQDVMDIPQNSMRTALTNVVGRQIIEGNLTSKEGEKCAKLWSAEFGALCAKAGITGLKPLPGGHRSYADAYYSLEAQKKKVTRKHLKIEFRQNAEEQTRNATSLLNTDATTNRIGAQ